MAINKEKMQERNLKDLFRLGGFKFTDTFFPYTSGEIGTYYVQSIDITKEGRAYQRAIGDMTELMQATLLGWDIYSMVISGGESRDWDFSNPIASKLAVPHAKIYKDGKILGADVKGKSVIHVADLNNEGSSIRDRWHPAIKANEGKLEYVFFYVDRLENGSDVLKQLGLESTSVIPLDKHAWDYLQQIGGVNEATYRNLCERGFSKESRDSWAKAMLRSDKGSKTLATLLSNEDAKEQVKGLKVIKKGYPEMGAELIDRMKHEGVDVPALIRFYSDKF